MKPAQKILLIEHCAAELTKLGGEQDIDFVLRIMGIGLSSWMETDNSFTYARSCINSTDVTDRVCNSSAESSDSWGATQV